MSRRPTIIDVARTAGVSKSTVSLVLQESPTVKTETRAAVRKAMADIGYVYNRAAANLRTSDVGLIGLVINDLRNPFFTEFAISAQMAFSTRGYATVIANTDEDPAIQEQVVSSMIEHGVSAMVISPAYGGGTKTFDALARTGMPVLQVMRQLACGEARFPLFAPDYVAGGRIAAEHVIARGARKIAFVGGLTDRHVTRERYQGVQEAMAAAGVDGPALFGQSSRAFGVDAARRLQRDYPDVDTAVCFNDLVGLGLSAGCAALGREVGRDLMVVGFDDIEECRTAYPPLSSVRCNIASLGAETADMVLSWLNDGQRPPDQTRRQVEFVARASSLGWKHEEPV